MNSATVLKFKDIALLNREAYMIMKCFNIKMIHTNRLIITIPDEEIEQTQDDNWTGFIQTMKVYIRKNVTSQVRNVSNKISKIEIRLKNVSSKVSKMEERLTKRFDR